MGALDSMTIAGWERKRSSMIQTGTYVRESDGAYLLYHSPTTWNDPVFAVKWLRFDRKGSHMYWRQVYGSEVAKLCKEIGYNLAPGEYVVIEP